MVHFYIIKHSSYVSSGPRTNIAHGLPSRRELQAGDLVMIDIHPIVNGYSADICRTVCVGQPNPEQQAAYHLYLNAQQTTIAKVKAGAGIADLEAHFQGMLRDAGHGEHIFGPPIHGVGIEFEEAPLPPGHAFFHGEKAPPPLPAKRGDRSRQLRIVPGPVGSAGGGYCAGRSGRARNTDRLPAPTRELRGLNLWPSFGRHHLLPAKTGEIHMFNHGRALPNQKRPGGRRTNSFRPPALRRCMD